VADNTRMNTQNMDIKRRQMELSMEYERKKKDVKKRLEQALHAYFDRKTGLLFGTEEGNKKAAELGIKKIWLLSVINDDTKPLSHEAFPIDFRIENEKLLNDFIALRTMPTEKQDDGEPGFWESMVPIWGSAREAEYNFNKGNYAIGIFYFILAVSDIFLIKSIVTGIGKGAWKLGSHSWIATRKWAGKNGWAGKGEHVHHWMIKQSFAKKHGLKSIANQPWNWVTFPNASKHMRFGHGFHYQGLLPGTFGEQLWYGTPHWFKIGAIDAGGHIIINNIDDE
jgi:hypothetical protein